jgi:hypothetical protein
MSSAPSSRSYKGLTIHFSKVVGNRIRYFGLLEARSPYYEGWYVYISKEGAERQWAKTEWKGNSDRAGNTPQGYGTPLWVVFEAEITENEFGEVCP